ncbi:MAG: isoprenylcysteine carboxylmethyltransferase family protein [Desulfobacula sp.]|nr:isoprenylcysteine carboxylmethyltransferase family protein [Desulfobacula sp.]
MIKIWIILLVHQILFQGMFVTKNILLAKKTGKQIRGHNKEANISIIFFAGFIALSFYFGLKTQPFATFELVNTWVSTGAGLLLLLLNLGISATSLIHLKDSWRVGVVENQKTKLVTTGIYRFTRNPYFVSYFLMFLAYTALLQNILLLGLAIIGFILIHQMIRKEETFLINLHGKNYLAYKNRVPRYFIF